MPLIFPNTLYPGVYVTESAAPGRSIHGTPTGIPAFVGRFDRGPVGRATTVTSMADFLQRFGGGTDDRPVTQAVADFFETGGFEAVIVRQFAVAPSASDADLGPTWPPAGTAHVAHHGVTFAAASPGRWGDDLTVAITTSNPASARALRLDPADDIVDIVVTLDPREGRPGVRQTTSLRFVTTRDGPHAITSVLEQSDALVRVTLGPSARLLPTSEPLALMGGSDSARLDAAAYHDPETGYPAALTGDPSWTLLVIPADAFGEDQDPVVLAEAARLCADQRAMLILDPPVRWTALAASGDLDAITTSDLGIPPSYAERACVFFPPPNLGSLGAAPHPLGGIVAGIFARTDASRGVWQAAAGVDAVVLGATDLDATLEDTARETLSGRGINTLREVPQVGTVLWGARTLAGTNAATSTFRYVPVRRLADYIERSLTAGTRWAVFEPNVQPLWAELAAATTAFLADLQRMGAFAGATPSDSFRVTCDATTTTLADQRAGIVNLRVDFCPVHPGEFIMLSLSIPAGAASD